MTKDELNMPWQVSNRCERPREHSWLSAPKSVRDRDSDPKILYLTLQKKFGNPSAVAAALSVWPWLKMGGIEAEKVHCRRNCVVFFEEGGKRGGQEEADLGL